MRKRSVSFVLGVFAIVAACGTDSSSNNSTGGPPPPGACKTGGTATGSFVAACNECGRAQCNAELSNKAGSRWAEQIWGIDGACKAFNECTCACFVSGMDPISCATSACIADMTSECQAANQAATECVNTKCAGPCMR
jgi:hypothetical protein